MIRALTLSTRTDACDDLIQGFGYPIRLFQQQCFYILVNHCQSILGRNSDAFLPVRNFSAGRVPILLSPHIIWFQSSRMHEIHLN